MTLVDGILIFLAGAGPAVIPISVVLCTFVYRRTKSIGWIAFIAGLTLILLIPSLVYLWARLSNGT